MSVLFAITSAVAVSVLVMKPLADASVPDRRNRFQIIDYIALMIYVQLGVVLGMSESMVAVVFWVMFLALLWAIATVLASKLGIVSAWKRFVLELVYAPALVAVFCLTAIVMWHVVKGEMVLALLGSLPILTAIIYGLRKVAHWLIADASSV